MNMVVDDTFRAAWVPAAQAFSVSADGSTSVATARIGGLPSDGGVIVGGLPPYFIGSVAFFPSAPVVGLTLTQTTSLIFGDTVAITSAPATVGGNYVGTIRAVVLDSSAPNKAITVDLPFTVSVAIQNTFASTLLNLMVSHYWAMDETSGVTLADTGVGGGLDLTLTAADNFYHRAWLPGPRADPPVYGLWKYNSTLPRPQFAGGDPVAGYATGCVGCWFMLSSANGVKNALVLQSYSNSFELKHGITITADLRIRFEVKGSFGNDILVQTAANFVDLGVPYYVHCEQVGDGGGLDLYVNGVDLGLVTQVSGGLSIDGYVDTFISAGAGPHAPTQLSVGSNGPGGSEGTFIGVIGAPYMGRNVTFGPVNVLSLFNNAQPNLPASDFHEFVQDLGYADKSLIGFHGGSYVGNNSQGVNMAAFTRNVTFNAAGATAPSAQNVLDNAGVGLQVASRYDMYKQVYGTNSPTYFTVAPINWEPTAGRTAGTVIATVTVNAVPTGIIKTIWTFGANPANSLELGVVGTASGWVLYFLARLGGGGLIYEVRSSVIEDNSGPNFGQLAVVQDGVSPRLYWNGIDVTGVPSTSTTPTIWVPSFGASSRWGGEAASASTNNWQPGHLHQMQEFIKALTPAQVLGNYNAAIGVL